MIELIVLIGKQGVAENFGVLWQALSNREVLIVDIKADGEVFFSAPAYIECGANRRYFTNGLNHEPADKPLAPKDLLLQVEKRFCLKDKDIEFSSPGGLMLSVGKDKKELRTRRAVWYVNHESGKRIFSFDLEKGEAGQVKKMEGTCGGNGDDNTKLGAALIKARLMFCPCLMPLRL